MSTKKTLQPDAATSDQSKTQILKQLDNSMICGINKHRYYRLFQKVNFLNIYQFKYNLFATMRFSDDRIKIVISSSFWDTPKCAGCREYVSPTEKSEVGWMMQQDEYRDAYIDFGMFQCEEYLNGLIDEIIRRETE